MAGFAGLSRPSPRLSEASGSVYPDVTRLSGLSTSCMSQAGNGTGGSVARIPAVPRRRLRGERNPFVDVNDVGAIYMRWSMIYVANDHPRPASHSPTTPVETRRPHMRDAIPTPTPRLRARPFGAHPPTPPPPPFLFGEVMPQPLTGGPSIAHMNNLMQELQPPRPHPVTAPRPAVGATTPMHAPGGGADTSHSER